MKELLINLLKLLSIYFVACLLLPLRLFPIRKNRILFTSLTGGKYMEYSCNPKYIYECLNDKYPKQYQIIWMFAEPHMYRKLISPDIILVKHYTIKSFYYLLTSKIVITNGSYVPWFLFRKKQVIINTWHGGGAYKALNLREDSVGNIIRKRNKIAGKNTSVFVTSSNAFTQFVIRGAFGFQGNVLNTGMPRNDFLVRQDTERAEKKVREYFGLKKDDNIVLYAPTYRDNNTFEKLDTLVVIKELEKQTGKNWICLQRLHRYDVKNEPEEILAQQILDATEYGDMQELLAASDILITDYSSSIWDYSFLYRPCFLYVPDLIYYKSNRGFYVEPEKWHFRYACTQKELIEELKYLEKEEWEERMKMHHSDLESCETGQASERVVQYIREISMKNNL